MTIKKIFILVGLIIIPFNLHALEKFTIQNLKEDEKAKKLETLNWYNWENPKDHYLEYQKANAEIYILEEEYYLKQNDINQYSWWIWGEENLDIDYMVFGETYTAYISYVDDGYVKLDDWKNVNPKDLLAEMNDIQDEWKEQQIAQEIDYVENMEWIFKPTLDEENRSVLMSYGNEWNGINGKYKTMQSNAMVLGRNGYVYLRVVYDIDNSTSDEELSENSDITKDFIKGISFNQGARHADYKSGDRVAALGIGGLVAGTLGVKTLAKAGAFAKFLPLLAKFWWVLLAPLAALGFLGKKSDTNSHENTPTRKKRSRRKTD
tara:strand:- start:336 stop:1295 length:960 start_codon:yes stop_codon:yes gene_type:complete